MLVEAPFHIKNSSISPPYVFAREKEGTMVTNQVVSEKTLTTRCPDCLNKMRVKVYRTGTYSGRCAVCNASVFSKQHSENERHIRIVKSNKT